MKLSPKEYRHLKRVLDEDLTERARLIKTCSQTTSDELLQRRINDYNQTKALRDLVEKKIREGVDETTGTPTQPFDDDLFQE